MDTLMDTADSNQQRALQYVKDVEVGVAEDVLAAHYDPDAVQLEHPNRLVTQGARRGVPELLEGSRRGKQVVANQRYEVLTSVAQGDTVALEVNWSATLKVPVGSLKPGDTMRAAFALFLTYKDGRIISQRNFDCFEPF